MPNTTEARPEQAQMANIAAASLQNKRLGTQTWCCGAICIACHIFAVIIRASCRQAPHLPTVRLTTMSGANALLWPTSHAKNCCRINLNNTKIFTYVIHSDSKRDSYTQIELLRAQCVALKIYVISFKFVLFFFFSFFLDCQIRESQQATPLRMPANDISY